MQPAFRQTEKRKFTAASLRTMSRPKKTKLRKDKKNIRILDDLPEEDENGDVIDESAEYGDDGVDLEPKKSSDAASAKIR